MFTIKLKDGYSQALSRDKFLSLFPRSMISSALNDLEANEIEITSSHVTPNILNTISDMTENKRIPYPIKCSKDELLLASRYLLIDELEVVASPMICDANRQC